MQIAGVSPSLQGAQQQQPAKTSAVLGPKAVTGAVTHGGLIQLTVVGHGFATGNRVAVASVGGVPNATGNWVVTFISSSVIDLQGTTFAGAYTSGGTATRTSRV